MSTCLELVQESRPSIGYAYSFCPTSSSCVVMPCVCVALGRCAVLLVECTCVHCPPLRALQASSPWLRLCRALAALCAC